MNKENLPELIEWFLVLSQGMLVFAMFLAAKGAGFMAALIKYKKELDKCKSQ